VRVHRSMYTHAHPSAQVYIKVVGLKTHSFLFFLLSPPSSSLLSLLMFFIWMNFPVGLPACSYEPSWNPVSSAVVGRHRRWHAVGNMQNNPLFKKIKLFSYVFFPPDSVFNLKISKCQSESLRSTKQRINKTTLGSRTVLVRFV